MYYIVQLKSAIHRNPIPPNHSIPRIVRALITAIKNNDGFKTEGVFRLSAGNAEEADLTNKLKQGYYDALDELKDCIVAAALLKKWLRSLTPMLVPVSLYPSILRAGAECNSKLCLDTFNKIPSPERETLIYIFEFLHELIQHRAITKMGSVNLAVVITPNIIRGPNTDPVVMMMNNKSENKFVEMLIENGNILNCIE